MDVIVKGLDPGSKYILQARSVTKDGRQSPWSNSFRLTTISDTTAPSPPTGLNWVVSGSAFIGTWIKPTTDSDGKPLKDFNGYEITVTANSISKKFISVQERFDFSFDQNLACFGTAQPTVQITVKTRDIAGNLSTGVSDTESNPIPANVTDFTATGIPLAIALTWDQSDEDDFRLFEIYMSTTSSGFTPGPSNLLTKTASTSFTYPTTAMIDHFFKIRQIDVFDQPSAGYASATAQPQNSTGIDTTPPDPPSAVTVTSAADSNGASHIDVGWTASPSTNLADYVVRYSTDEIAWQYVTVPGDRTTAKINNLRPNTTYYVAVAGVSFVSSYSAFINAGTYPITTAADTTPPSKPADPTVSFNTSLVQVAHSTLKDAGGNLEADTRYLEVHGSTNSAFAPSSTTLIGTIDVPAVGVAVSGNFNVPVTTSTTNMYWKVIAVDYAGNKSPESDEVTGLPGLIVGANIADATIGNAKINDLSAAKLIAGTAFINNLNIRSQLTIDDAAGFIQSSNYNAGSQTGWRLDQSGLVIYDGSIAAKSLKLQNGSNMALPLFADFEFAEDYYHSSANVGNSTNLTATVGMGLAVQYTGPKTNKQALRLWNAVITSATTHTLHFAPGGASATGVNIDIAPGDYIFSVWAKKNGSSDQNIKLGLYPDTGSAIASSNISVTSTSYTRYSAVLTVPSGVNKVKMYMDVTPSTTGYDIVIDAMQLEPKFTAETAPSPWKPPSTTTIDGGAIITGSIRSSSASTTIPGQPAWSINTQGNMQIGDGYVRGTLVIGGPTDSINIMPGLYSSFESTSTLYANGSNVPNPSTFDFNNPSLWSGNIQNTGAFTGSQAMRFFSSTFPTGGVDIVYFTASPGAAEDSGRNIPMVAGQTYIISMYVKANNGSLLHKVRMVAYGNVDNFIYLGSADTTLTTSWQRISATYTAADSSLLLALQANALVGGTSIDFSIDGIQVEVAAPGQTTPTTFVDAAPGKSVLRSTSYIAGTAGWAINSDGTVEFNNGIFRGTLDIAAKINNKTYRTQFTNQSAMYRKQFFGDNYNVSGTEPTQLMQGTNFAPAGGGVVNAKRDVQSVFRMTPEGGVQIMFDPSRSASIFTTDGNNDISSSNTALTNYYGYSDFRSGMGFGRGWGPSWQTIGQDYPENSFYTEIISKSRTPSGLGTAVVNGGLQTFTNASNHAAKFAPFDSTSIYAQGKYNIVSNNRVAANYDTFLNATANFYPNNTVRTNMNITAIVTDRTIDAENASAVTFKTVQASATGATPSIFFTPNTSTYNIPVTPGEELYPAMQMICPTAMNALKYRWILKTNNGVTVQSASTYFVPSDSVTTKMYRTEIFPSLVVPAGATSAYLGFQLEGTFTAPQTFYFSCMELIQVSDTTGLYGWDNYVSHFNKYRYYARGQSEAFDGTARAGAFSGQYGQATNLDLDAVEVGLFDRYPVSYLTATDLNAGTRAGVTVTPDKINLQVENISGINDGVIVDRTSGYLKARVSGEWINLPAPQNGWVVTGGAYAQPGYKRMPDGTVQLRGAIQNGTQGAVIWTLPVGFRPLYEMVLPCASGTPTTGTRLQVQTSGNIYVYSSGAGPIYMETIKFSTI